MVITVGIDEDAHELVIQKQTEIYVRTKEKRKISKIVSDAIRHGIDQVG